MVLVFQRNLFNEGRICNVDASDWLLEECLPPVVVAREIPSLAILLHVPDVAGLNLKTMKEGNVPVKDFIIPSTLKDNMDCLPHLGAESLMPDFLVLLFRGAGTLDPAACALMLE